MTIDELKNTLLHSDNDAWRDDAAEELAKHWNDPAAEEAIDEAMRSGKLDNSLTRTCVESLAEIWINRGKPNLSIYDRFSGEHKAIARALLESSTPRIQLL